MENEMRKDIDRVKNFGKFINENTETDEKFKTMKPQKFSTRRKNFTIKGLFEVNENANMMQMSKDEKWNLTKEENPIFDAIIESYLQVKTGMPFNFVTNCCVMKENDDNLFIQYDNNLFYLHTANIQAVKDLSLNEAINF